MNVEAIARVVRDAIEHQSTQFKAMLGTASADMEQRLASAVRAHAELEDKNAANLEALRKSLDRSEDVAALRDTVATLKTYIDDVQAAHSIVIDELKIALKAKDAELLAAHESLARNVESVSKSLDERAADMSARMAEFASKDATTKALESTNESLRQSLAERDARIEAMEKRLEESSEALTKAMDDLSRSAIDSVDAVKASIETERASVDKSISAVRDGLVAPARVDAVELLGASLAERMATVDTAVSELKSLQLPEIPAEVVAIPARLAEFESVLAELVEKSTGYMHFRGSWDERDDYKLGATVAHKNSLWVAMREKDMGIPGERDSGWRMCIKSGKVIPPYEHR